MSSATKRRPRGGGKPTSKAREAKLKKNNSNLNDDASSESNSDYGAGASAANDVDPDNYDDPARSCDHTQRERSSNDVNLSDEKKVDDIDDRLRRPRRSKRAKDKEKDKEIRKQMKLMKKDCKKLQKSLGKWMLETKVVSPSEVKSTVKQFLAENVSAPESADSLSDESSKSPSLSSNVYKWSSPHIRNFFASANNNNGVIQTNRLDIKLACPIGKSRIKHPVRASVCNHVQPFDRDTFLKLEKVSHAKKKKSFCPICNLEISSALLIEDAFFADVLAKSGVDDDEVVVYADGLWHPRARKNECETKNLSDEVVLGDDEDDDNDDEEENDDIQVTNVLKPEKKSIFVDLTDDSLPLQELGDDDEDDDVIVL